MATRRVHRLFRRRREGSPAPQPGTAQVGHRTLVVMFEYGVFPPLWSDGDWDPTIDVRSRDTWPWLSDDLWDRLMGWAHLGDSMLPDEWPEGAYEGWNDEGRRLAAEIRAVTPRGELNVVYYDEVLDRQVAIEPGT